MIRHLIDLFDLSAEAAVDLIDRAIDLKRHDQQGHRPPYLEGRTLGLIFEKPSLRTGSASRRPSPSSGATRSS